MTDRAPLWTHDLLPDEKGRIVKCVHNILTILAYHPDWAGVFRDSDGYVLVLKQLPHSALFKDRSVLDKWDNPRKWDSEDTLRTQVWFTTNYGFEPSARDVEKCARVIAVRNPMPLAPPRWRGKPGHSPAALAAQNSADSERKDSQ